MKTVTSSLLCACLLFISSQASAAIHAEVDRKRVNVGDSIRLTLRPDSGEDLDDIYLSSLEQYFIIAGTSSNSRINLFNGKREIIRERELSLFPRRQGILTIPALGPQGQSSQPISIIVEEARTDIDAEDDLYVEAEINRDNTWVQGQLIYTFRLFQAVDLEERPKLTPLALDNASIEELETRSYQSQVNGRSFLVTELRYAIFPERSGQLQIPSLTLSARLRDPRQSRFTLGKRGILVRRQTPALSIEVKPVPASYPDSAWLPLENLEIEQSWSSNPQELGPGDSITRTITLRAQGLPGEQLPALNTASVEGLKVYMDQPKSQTLRDDAGLTGLGISSAAILATAAGSHQLPALKIPWWDMASNSIRYAELPGVTLNVVAADLPADAQQQVEVNTNSPERPLNEPAVGVPASPWQWLSAALLLAWSITLYAWLRARRSDPGTSKSVRHEDTSEKQYWGELARSCNSNDAAASRTALRDWAQSFFQLALKPSLTELDTRLGQGEITPLLFELDEKLYSEASSPWSGARLLELLGQWRRENHETKPARQELAPLNQ